MTVLREEMGLKSLISKRNTSETVMKSPRSSSLASGRKVPTIFSHVSSTLTTDPAVFSVGLHYLLTLHPLLHFPGTQNIGQ